MIIYDSKKWNTLFEIIFKTFKESYNLRQLLRFILFVAIYSSAATTFILEVLHGKYTIDTVFFSLLGVILSLFLVFRLNSSYDRWWEGRIHWGALINHSRTLSLVLNSLVSPDDKKRRKFFVTNIANFALALQWHLRDDTRLGKLIYLNRSYLEDLEKIKHAPNQIASYMYDEVEMMHRKQLIGDVDKLHLREVLRGLIDVLGACERIKNTPIPFSHSTFIKMFMIIYIVILPFGLADAFGYLAIPAVVVMSFAMIGIEVISEEIENPFGLDANDLPTSHLSDVIRESVYEILHVKSEFSELNKIKKSAEVVH